MGVNSSEIRTDVNISSSFYLRAGLGRVAREAVGREQIPMAIPFGVGEDTGFEKSYIVGEDFRLLGA